MHVGDHPSQTEARNTPRANNTFGSVQLLRSEQGYWTNGVGSVVGRWAVSDSVVRLAGRSTAARTRTVPVLLHARGAEKPGFRPFAQMEQLDQIYESEELFPVFANRLLSASRPEYEDFLQWGGFDIAAKTSNQFPRTSRRDASNDDEKGMRGDSVRHRQHEPQAGGRPQRVDASRSAEA